MDRFYSMLRSEEDDIDDNETNVKNTKQLQKKFVFDAFSIHISSRRVLHQ